MMTFNIGGKDCTFKFGFGFMKEINKTDKVKENGIEKEVGMRTAIAGIIDGDVSDLAKVLFYGSRTEEVQPTMKEIEAFIEDENTDIEAVFETVLDFLKKANVTKKTTMWLVNYWEKQVEKEKQKQ